MFYANYVNPPFFFFFNDTATTEIYTLSLHDALPISASLPAPTPCRRSRPRRTRCSHKPAPTTSCPRPSRTITSDLVLWWRHHSHVSDSNGVGRRDRRWSADRHSKLPNLE